MQFTLLDAHREICCFYCLCPFADDSHEVLVPNSLVLSERRHILWELAVCTVVPRQLLLQRQHLIAIPHRPAAGARAAVSVHVPAVHVSTSDIFNLHSITLAMRFGRHAFVVMLSYSWCACVFACASRHNPSCCSGCTRPRLLTVESGCTALFGVTSPSCARSCGIAHAFRYL